MDTTRRAWEPKGQGPSDGVAVRGLVNGRGPRRRRGKDSPEGAYRPDGPCPQATARRARACPSAPTPSGVTPPSPRRDLRENGKGRYRTCAGTAGHGGTCGRTKRADIVRRQGRQDMARSAGERKGAISFGGRGKRGRRVLCATWGGVRPRGAHRSIIRMVLPTILRKSG